MPLKTKTGQELVKAFQTILSSGRKPNKLQTDQGKEFVNEHFQKFLRDKNIHFFTTNSGLKASVVERYNRTLKNKMYRYFTAKNTLRYIDVLPKLVSSYNKTYNLSQVGVYVDGEQIPRKPLTLKFDADGGQNFMAGFQTLF